MIKICVSILVLLLAESAFGQISPNVIIPEGPLLALHVYELKFDSTFKGFITFNNGSVVRSGNAFQLTATQNGTLRIYDVDNLDTLLLKKVNLQFRDPVFAVFVAGKKSGEGISLKDLRRNSITVEVPNNELSLYIPIVKIKARYCINNIIKYTEFEGRVMPNELIDELTSSPAILVLEVQIKLGHRLVNLAPSVYFINR